MRVVALAGKQVQSATTWLGICTGILMVVLFMKSEWGNRVMASVRQYVQPCCKSPRQSWTRR